MSRVNFVWLGAGLIIGLLVGGFLPHAPLHAVATDRHENFAIATGAVDDSTEAIFFLDFLTGDLSAAVINPVKLPPVLGYVYNRNVFADFQVDASKNPKFLMVTGNLPLRPAGGGSAQFAGAVVYIAEVTSGKVACYAMPFNRGQFNNSIGVRLDFAPVYVGPFRQAIVR